MVTAVAAFSLLPLHSGNATVVHRLPEVSFTCWLYIITCHHLCTYKAARMSTNATASLGFSVGCNGGLEYNNNTTFSSCPTGDDAGYNIYETAPTGQQGCVEITLSADSCAAACLSSPQSCSTTLNSGSYEVRNCRTMKSPTQLIL